MKNLIGIIICLFCVIASFGLLEEAITREDKYNCIKLQMYSTQYENFWISRADKELCDKLGISINAEVK